MKGISSTSSAEAAGAASAAADDDDDPPPPPSYPPLSSPSPPLHPAIAISSMRFWFAAQHDRRSTEGMVMGTSTGVGDESAAVLPE